MLLRWLTLVLVALSVLGQPSQPQPSSVPQTEQIVISMNDDRLVYSGSNSWSNYSNECGGSIESLTPQSTVSVSFEGTWAEVNFLGQTNGSLVNITLDSNWIETVDTYDDTDVDSCHIISVVRSGFESDVPHTLELVYAGAGLTEAKHPSFVVQNISYYDATDIIRIPEQTIIGAGFGGGMSLVILFGIFLCYGRNCFRKRPPTQHSLDKEILGNSGSMAPIQKVPASTTNLNATITSAAGSSTIGTRFASWSSAHIPLPPMFKFGAEDDSDLPAPPAFLTEKDSVSEIDDLRKRYPDGL